MIWSPSQCAPSRRSLTASGRLEMFAGVGRLVDLRHCRGQRPPAAAAQTRTRAHPQRAVIDRLVDGLHAGPPRRVLGDEVRPDRHRGPPQAQLGGDPFPQRAPNRQEAPPRAARRPLGAPLRRRRSVAATTTPAVDLPGDRRRVTAHPAGDRRPTRHRVSHQRAADLLAFVQRQRYAWHAGTSIGRCLSWHRSS